MIARVAAWLSACGAAIALAIALIALALVFSARLAGAVADGYATPIVAVPYARHPPTIDGSIDDEEWREAVSYAALQIAEHPVSARQARIWWCWDEEHLYLAMRSPLRPGEKPIQAHRARDADCQDVIFDDSWECWLDVGTTTPDGQPTFFQYLGNVAGARFDVLHEPAVGNMRFGWTAGWEPKNRVTPDGSAWEMEVAIPRTSVYVPTALHDGLALRALVSRNFKRPWSQATLEGTGSFSARETFAKMTLRKDSPGLRIDVADPAHATFGLALSAHADQPTRVRWRFASDGGAHAEGRLDAGADHAAKTNSIAADLARDQPGSGKFRVTITDDAGTTTLFDWCAERRFADVEALTTTIADPEDAVALDLSYNPVRDYLRVTGDFIGFAARTRIAAYRVAVLDATGAELVARDLALDELAYVRAVVPLPPLAPGEYRAVLTCRDAAGAVVVERAQPFTKRDPKAFAWWETKDGDCDRVLAPWTPVTWAGGVVGTWGRSATIGAAGLPSAMTSQGRALLSAPARLVATDDAGKALVAAPGAVETVSQAPHRVVARTTSALGAVEVASTVTCEYDGMYRIDLRLTPRAPTTLSRVRVELPLADDIADYLHASGEGIRYGFWYGFLPKDRAGVVWDSRAVDSQPMKLGSFVPFVWIGTSRGAPAGLCWFADSDEGWEPGDAAPAIAVERDAAGHATLALNLIAAPTLIDAPRTIAFALQATPVKPLASGWRMASWWTGDTFKDWAGVEKQGGHLIFTSIPFPLEPAASKTMVDARHGESNAGIFGFPGYRANAVPYFEHVSIGERFVPEFPYFAEEWRTTVSRGFDYGGSFADFMVHHVAGWARDCGIDGFYLDNVYPLADDNLAAGRGWKLRDGRIQPAYRLFATRRYLLRLRAALAEHGKTGNLVIHMTNNLVIPWIGAADIALDGEANVLYADSGKDFIDAWSRDRFRGCIPQQWGVAVDFLQEHQGEWQHDALMKAMRAYTGFVLAHDVLASANANSLNQPAWKARERFGMKNDDVRFVGYWQDDAPRATPASVIASCWTRPGAVLIDAVATGEDADATVAVDAARLGLRGNLTAIDAETDEPLAIDHGAIRARIARHDYRHILVTGTTP